MTYQVGDKVAFIYKRCNCAGGGDSEQHGDIVGIVPDGAYTWYQISTPSGVYYTKGKDVIKVLSPSA